MSIYFSVFFFPIIISVFFSFDTEQPNPIDEESPEENDKGETVGPEVIFLRYVLLAEVRLLRAVCAYLPLPLQQLVHSLFMILLVEIGFQCNELIRSGYLAAGVVLYVIYVSLLLVLISQGIYITCLPRRSLVTESRGLLNIVVSQPRHHREDDGADDVDDGGAYGKADKVRATTKVVLVTPRPPPVADSDGPGDRGKDHPASSDNKNTISGNTMNNSGNTMNNSGNTIMGNVYNLSDSESDSEDFEYLRRFLVDGDDDDESSLEGWGVNGKGFLGVGEGEGEEGDWHSLLSNSSLEKYDDDDDDDDEEDDDDDDHEHEHEYQTKKKYRKQEKDVDDVAIADIEVEVDLEQQQQQQQQQQKKNNGRKVRLAEESKFLT